MAELMKEDVSSFSNILSTIMSIENCGQGDKCKQNINIFTFKSTFIVNSVTIQKESLGLTTLQGLSDVVHPPSLGRKFMLISTEKERKSSVDFEADNNDSYEHTDEAEDCLDTITTVDKQVAISHQNIVRAGPPSSSFVYYVDAKTNLQSIGGILNEESINIEGLLPVKFTDARYILSVYIQAISKLRNNFTGKDIESIEIPWLMIKCDKKPPQLASWVYSTIDLEANGEQAPHGCFRSFIVKERNGIFEYEEAAQKLQAKKGKLSFMSRYFLLGDASTRFLQDTNTSTLYLEFAWKERSFPLDPPPLSADAVAKFKIIPSDPCSPLATVFQELSRLASIAAAGNAGFNWSGNSTENARVVDLLPSFFEELMTVKYTDEPPKQDEKTKDFSPLLSYMLDGFKRNDMDFTDKLWAFIKNARDMEEVIACLNHIFAAVCTREIQPVFSSENGTKIATMIREFYKSSNLGNASDALQEKLNIILEDADQVLEILADIGMEKFKKDYTCFFVNEEWATFGQLEPIINNAHGLQERMSAIWKLHHCLELVSIGKAYLHLEIDHLRILLRAGLEYYKSNSASAAPPTFSISIPSVSASAQALNELCQGIKPETWKAASASSLEGAENLSMFILSEDDDKENHDDINVDLSLQDSEFKVVLYCAKSISESRMKVF